MFHLNPLFIKIIHNLNDWGLMCWPHVTPVLAEWSFSCLLTSIYEFTVGWEVLALNEQLRNVIVTSRYCLSSTPRPSQCSLFSICFSVHRIGKDRGVFKIVTLHQNTVQYLYTYVPHVDILSYLQTHITLQYDSPKWCKNRKWYTVSSLSTVKWGLPVTVESSEKDGIRPVEKPKHIKDWF